jgi:hypothetical protein
MIKYQCDLCGKESQKQMENITLHWESGNKKQWDVCPDCCEAFSSMMQDLPLSNKRSSETWQDYKDSQIFVKNLRESINETMS